MNLLSFHKIGLAQGNRSRIWLESQRLCRAGFNPGTPFQVTESFGKITITKSPSGSRTVSQRRQAGSQRPIIEICSKSVEQVFPDVPTVKAKTSFGKIELSASIRGFLIGKNRQKKENFRVLELFAGGGTLSDAVQTNPVFSHVAGMEIEPNYADVWALKNPDALLIQSDIRLIHPAEIPKYDILVGGIPCTSHSTMGRAKKSLKGKPEEGDTGDLFVHVINLIAYHMPAACVFENVPSFGTSLSGHVLKTSLSHLGYHLEEVVLEPHTQWCEPSDRRRWCLIATLHPHFTLQIPHIPFFTDVAQYLDPEMEDQDKEDVCRIAKTIAGLHAHNARHAALGHGFALTTINRKSTKVPTIPKSYYKINTGPFVETKFGLRMLRLHEVEAIMGASAGTPNYATGIQILGQGVQTRIWTTIFKQLGDFLANPEKAESTITANTLISEKEPAHPSPIVSPKTHIQLELLIT